MGKGTLAIYVKKQYNQLFDLFFFTPFHCANPCVAQVCCECIAAFSSVKQCL
jgi:hypothetical protein